MVNDPFNGQFVLARAHVPKGADRGKFSAVVWSVFTDAAELIAERIREMSPDELSTLRSMRMAFDYNPQHRTLELIVCAEPSKKWSASPSMGDIIMALGVEVER